MGWPLQRDTGKVGAPCGRVLYTLESMMQHQDHQQEQQQCSTLFSSHRPFCFWTPAALSASSSLPLVAELEDTWGRCTAYGVAAPSSKTTHLASREQYVFDETAQATDLWYDFWKTHWPERHRRRTATITSSGGNNHCNLVADWKDSSAYLPTQVAL